MDQPTPGRCTRGRHPVFAPALAAMLMSTVMGTSSSKPLVIPCYLVLMTPSTIDCLVKNELKFATLSCHLMLISGLQKYVPHLWDKKSRSKGQGEAANQQLSLERHDVVSAKGQL